MANQPINILAIESSCDETASAIIQDGKVLANIVATQHVHSSYGGVVPELASRAHQINIVPTVTESLNRAKLTKNNLSAVGFTLGPGLMGSLLVGISFAKSLGMALGLPLIEVNHLHAHVHALFTLETKPPFPFLCLLVSGGHTQIIRVQDYNSMEVVGQTLDDAAGEAFDKIARVMELSYPGGAQIDNLGKSGNSLAFEFPKPRIPDFNYSFSGFKTAFLYFFRDKMKTDNLFFEKNKSDICASVQSNISQILLDKLKKAAKHFKISHLGLVGGVAANSELRKQFMDTCAKEQWRGYIPDFEYCTDNAAMIGVCAYHKFLKSDFSQHSALPYAKSQI